MILHEVRACPSVSHLAKDDQLAWKLAQLAIDPVAIDSDVADMIVNRVIDNAAVAIAALNRHPVISARAQALAHPGDGGATVFGCLPNKTVCAEWAAWANGTAVRELDFHDTFLAADYAHPADNIPALIAVAQQCDRTGRDLVRAIATAYEVQVSLVKGVCLHRHRIDHIAHIGPSVAAGVGTLLGLDCETIYQAIQQALHCTITTRQSRKGEISSWKAYAPAHAGKTAIEAVDRAMRGEGSPSPAWEGEDGLIGWILDGRTARDQGQSPYEASYSIPLPEPGESRRAILETYTKAHSAEYQSQALIDLAFRMRNAIMDFEAIREIIIHTSQHTHNVIGTGANDPQKMDPQASRETLDHSIMYIFAVALQDGNWHHQKSYLAERARRADTVRLWHKIRTCEDTEWTRRYHSADLAEKAFGARVEIVFADGRKLTDEIANADAHPLGAKPYVRTDYIGKFGKLTESILTKSAQEHFLQSVQDLSRLEAEELDKLNPAVPEGCLDVSASAGIF